jgi:NTE family protein
MRKALVLSGGGLSGAYQAGAWRVLGERFRPDLIVGASIGALNGWMIAGGATGDDLVRCWRDMDGRAEPRLKRPRHLRDGFVDDAPVRETIGRIMGGWIPKVEYAVVLTDLLRMKPCFVKYPDARAEHLAASCAVMAVLPQPRIDGRTYTDGGLLNSLPLWAAVELGATEIVGLHVLPHMPWYIRSFARTASWYGGFNPAVPPEVTVTIVAPERPLGKPSHTAFYDRERIEGWMDWGEQDALRVLDVRN